jgi:hypothetical protein
MMRYIFLLFVLISCASSKSREEIEAQIKPKYHKQVLAIRYETLKNVEVIETFLKDLSLTENPYKTLFEKCGMKLKSTVSHLQILECQFNSVKDSLVGVEFYEVFTSLTNEEIIQNHFIFLPRAIEILRKKQNLKIAQIESDMFHEINSVHFNEIERNQRRRKIISSAFGGLAQGSNTSNRIENGRSCSSDYECGVNQACINQSGVGLGYCSQVVDQHGIQKYDYVPSGNIKKAKPCTKYVDC